ncbi:serine/threonine-protein kinase [Curtobacterium sp. PhB115]|uniref:serine/threonine-protein kinase n=1 Tax=Curtobacterium sp. PhB115 TaxID=2485173 RepID=UPI000F4AFB8D|nr:serine/threonine-protein kinase [Curtobacterium sp. PhB115]ROP72488.1 serine/threonine protein kinase [Curtobacterium sp. PhB115]
MEERVFGGRYRVTGTLGHGGMASVYRAVDEQLGREVAVKVFRIGPVDHGERARAEAEIQTLATLRSPALVTLYDAALDDVDGDSYLVMELVPGSDLATRLREGALDPATAARVGAQVADGLAAVHAQGIVHRDVKPANVLLESDGSHVKLADFGIALLRDASRVTGTGTVMGTAAYLAPEQVLAQEITGKADVYALGLVLLECLTGTRPFPGSAVESATARLTRGPAIDQHLPTAWRTLLHVMTSQDPADRPSAAEAAERLRALGRDEPPTATHLLPGGPGTVTPAGAAGLGAAAGAAGAAAAAGAAHADDATRVMPASSASSPGGTQAADDATRVMNAQQPNAADDVSTTVLGAQGGAQGAQGGPGGATPPPAPPVRPGPGNDPTKREKRRKGPIITAIVVVVLVLIGIGVAVFALGGDDDKTPAPTDTTSTAPTEQQPSEQPSEEQQPSQPTEQQPSEPEQQPSEPEQQPSEPSEEPSQPTEPSQDPSVGPEPSTPVTNPVQDPQDSADTESDTGPAADAGADAGTDAVSDTAPGNSENAPGQNKG